MGSNTRILIEKEILDSLNARILSIEICLSGLAGKLRNELETVAKIKELAEQSKHLINRITAEPRRDD
ncbi:MAG: hypothetical protein AB1646_23235 [Thermodesulfobacteriota bacterium]